MKQCAQTCKCMHMVISLKKKHTKSIGMGEFWLFAWSHGFLLRTSHELSYVNLQLHYIVSINQSLSLLLMFTEIGKNLCYFSLFLSPLCVLVRRPRPTVLLPNDEPFSSLVNVYPTLSALSQDSRLRLKLNIVT